MTPARPKRSTRCSVCNSPDRAKINRALSEPGASTRVIGQEFGIGYKSVERHRDHHMRADQPAERMQAIVDAQVDRADTLSDRANALMVKMEALLEKASLKGKTQDAVKASGQILSCIRLLAELTGKLQQASTVSVFLNPTWLTVQGRLIAALEPYPEARGAVLKALEGLPG